MTWRVTKGSAGHVVIQKCSPCQGLVWAQVLLEKKVNIHRGQAVFPDTLRVCTVTHLAAFQRLHTASWSRHFKDHSSQGHVAPVTEQQIRRLHLLLSYSGPQSKLVAFQVTQLMTQMKHTLLPKSKVSHHVLCFFLNDGKDQMQQLVLTLEEIS